MTSPGLPPSTPDSPPSAPDLQPTSRLVREWAACAIVASVARFVPLPLVDDVLKERATRIAVARTLKANGLTYPVTDVDVLYSGVQGWVAQARRYVVGVPARVVLFPVRKYVALLGSVRGVPQDVMEVLLLARTVHRAAARGQLDGGDARRLRARARAVRLAYDAALREMDVRLLLTALADALSQGAGLAQAAVDRARTVLGRDHRGAPGPSLPGDDIDDVTDEAELASGAVAVEAVLERPDVRALLARFDAHVDATLAAHPGSRR